MSHFSTIKSEAGVLSATGLISKILTALKTGKWHQFCKFLKFIKFNLDGFCCCLGVKEQYYALKTKYSCHRTYHHLSLWPNSSSFFFFKLNEGGSISSWLISVSKQKSPFSMIKHQKLCSAVSLGYNLLTEWQSPFFSSLDDLLRRKGALLNAETAVCSDLEAAGVLKLTFR